MSKIQRMWHYHSYIYKYSWDVAQKLGRRSVIEYINQFENKKILEVGVGIGSDVHKYNRSHDLYLTDYNEAMIKQCQKNIHKADMGNVSYIGIMDAGNLCFGDEEFDLVIATYLLPTVTHPDLVLQEMERVLKKDGKIVICNQDYGSRKMKKFMPFKAVNAVTKRLGWNFTFSVIPLLEANSLVVEEHKKIFPIYDLYVLVKK
jgi:phosphatidylethanolamine/phosphatidyl-N-methylethanolamine N-methyltransferase